MINLEQCKEKFKTYVNNYDMKDEKIYLKYHHTMRVVDFCEKIADSLNLNETDKKIAMLIGLLHDIGRFEQIKVYNTFIDKDSIDHANYGVDILTTNNFISEFIKDNNVQKIILTAIQNHNKFSIQEDLDEKTQMFCKIIRDADKLDIFNIFINQNLKIEHTDSHISDKIYNDLINKKVCKDLDLKTQLDYYLRQVGMFYDLNYKYSLNYVKENKLTNKLIDVIIENNEHEKHKLNSIKEKLNEFLNE